MTFGVVVVVGILGWQLKLRGWVKYSGIHIANKCAGPLFVGAATVNRGFDWLYADSSRQVVRNDCFARNAIR